MELKYGQLLLNFAFKFNVRLYTWDNNSYLRFNRDPVDMMIGYLKQYFDPKHAEDGFSLGISMGMGQGLTPDHFSAQPEQFLSGEFDCSP